MTEAGSVLALDVGERRIGVAIASRIAKLPRPLTTLQNSPSVWEDIRTIVKNEQADIIVVGLPRGLSGNDTKQTLEVRDFASKLADETGIPVELQDEALTSHQAEAELVSRKRGFDKGMVDALAATYILEDYLLSMRGTAS